MDGVGTDCVKFCKKGLIFLLLTLVLLTITFSITTVKANAYGGAGAIVIEESTNRILYQNNINKKLPMASTTKIATAITVLENCNTDEKIKIPKKAVGIEGSSIYLQEGDEYTVGDLLFGLMLQSGNDAATALALHVGEGDMDNFINKMNALAKKVGATATNFTNPHGLHHAEHYTTASDLAMITSYGFKNPHFRKIVSAKSATISDGKGGERTIANKNKILKEYEGGNGVKTGFTKVAGRCLVSSAKRDNMQVICVVLNCGAMFEESKALMSKAFDEYRMIKVADKEKILAEAGVKNSKGEVVGVPLFVKNDIFVPVKKGQMPNLTFRFKERKENAVIKEGGRVGKINVYDNNCLLFSEKAYSMVNE